MIPPADALKQFQEFIWDFYRLNGRSFSWRNIENPYHIVVSEIMLQQTQTYRVEPKFERFVSELSTFDALANAPLRDVLSLWQGLGYNRRGLYLQQIAQKIVREHNGIVPDNPDVLLTFPGIGKATAASITTFVYNKPCTFIETNVRTVYIHCFFNHQADIADAQLMPLIEVTVDQDNPREWYYAIMDYGVHLKKTLPNPSRKSKHHIKQSKFEGSDRQIRGAIIRLLTEKPHIVIDELLKTIGQKERTEKILETLYKDKLIKKNGVSISITH